MFDEETIRSEGASRRAAIRLFQRAFQAQAEKDYETAAELYRRSIEACPTSEAHTFLGWVYSFQGRLDDAIEQCLEAIRVDPSLGNPYNDIGSYMLARGDLWSCVVWFRRALQAPRYESRVFPHINLGHVYEKRRRPLDAARHYGLALEEDPSFTRAEQALRRIQAQLN